MSFEEVDFLDEVFMAEQKQYSEAYCKAFQLSSQTAPSSELPDRSDELHSFWIHGLQYGAQLGLELYSYRGLADEVLASWTLGSVSSSMEDVNKHHSVHIARHLLHLLNGSPGPLSRSCQEFIKHPTFETDLSLIRSKAKQLMAALKIHTARKTTINYDF
ncbi:hypothetical protein EmuJ_001028450 [Echinococcus multilocularis]|uniref:Uncharacterized protein n=1 Tax=Echinococcus multilocularis TaxID=6211 RepID=A0A068YJX0_ECHMU|nr:hypothetical protein EmuJ_001028450 [Echinococcus multilocularis]